MAAPHRRAGRRARPQGAGGARKRRARLASFLRATLSRSAEGSIPLREEVALARDYLAVEEVRFGPRLRVKVELADHADVVVVGECGDGFTALKAVQELTPDLLLLDIQMSKLTGFEVLELLLLQGLLDLRAAPQGILHPKEKRVLAVLDVSQGAVVRPGPLAPRWSRPPGST